MNELAQNLRSTIEMALEDLNGITESQAQRIKIEGQWTAKEVLGHLIDSAANNHQRFVRALYGNELLFIRYDQEQWVKTQRYNQVAWQALIQLWKDYNLHLAHIIEGISEKGLNVSRPCYVLDDTGLQLVNANEPITLIYLITDYMRHMRDHLQQIERAVA